MTRGDSDLKEAAQAKQLVSGVSSVFNSDDLSPNMVGYAPCYEWERGGSDQTNKGKGG